jgi:hypothetical protein
MLTGWPQEDLLDALGGTSAAGGALFDRLEDVLPGPTKQIMVGAPGCLLQPSAPEYLVCDCLATAAPHDSRRW